MSTAPAPPHDRLRHAWLAVVAAVVLGALAAELATDRVEDDTLPPVDAGPFRGEPESGFRAVGAGPLPAGFLQASTGIMAALEGWRAQPFSADVSVAWRASDPDGRWGWYDATGDQLVVVDPPDPTLGPMTLVHELHHALQDQQHDLASFRPVDPTSDAGLARLALVEGEAMLAGAELLGVGLALHDGLPTQRALGDEQLEVLFLYMDGARFVQHLREAGGWRTVDAAWRHPPDNTGAILDPRWYRAGGVATAPAELGGGARVGALGLMKWLAAAPGTRADARELAAAWRGDARRGDGAEAVWVLLLADAEAAATLGMAVGDRAAVAVEGARVTLRGADLP